MGKEKQTEKEVTTNATEEIKEHLGLEKKWEALQKFVEASDVTGVSFGETDENNKFMQSSFRIQGQDIPFFLVINNSVYTYLQVYVAQGLSAEQKETVLPYLNKLNEKYTMLKYYLNTEGQLVMVCSMPAADDHFQPALLIALIDQVQSHLETEFSGIMKQVWQGK